MPEPSTANRQDPVGEEEPAEARDFARASPEPLAAAAPAEAPPSPIEVDARRLLGLDPSGLVRMLGRPDFARNDPPAQVWQYYSEACILDLFLYPEGEEQTYRAVHYEIRDRRAKEAGGPDCLGERLTLAR